MKLNPKILLPIVIIAGGGVAAAGLIAARSAVQTRPPETPAPLIRTIDVAFESIQLKVPAQGTIAARTESDLIAQVSGEVIEVAPAFAAGGFFRQGDTLARIDPRDYELALTTARVQVAQAELQLAREREESRIAKEEWDRVGKGKPTSLVLREPHMRQARAALEAARAQVGRARLNLERTHIQAPFDGRVRSKRIDVGQVVGPNTPLGRIYAVDYAEVELPVPDRELAYLNLDLSFTKNGELTGPMVDIRADFAGERRSWEGQVVRVGGEIDPTTRMVHLVARVDDPYGISGETETTAFPLAVGLFVEADVLGKRADRVVLLPRAALRGADQVLVVKDGRLYFRRITILRADDEHVVVSAGLTEGEKVCVSPLAAVVDGMRVRTKDDAPVIRSEGGVG